MPLQLSSIHPRWLFLAALLLLASQARALSAGTLNWDGQLSAGLPSLPYGLQLGGELGSSWRFWGEDPLPLLPIAGEALGEPWKYGALRLCADASSNGAQDHASATAQLEPVGCLTLKATLGRDWQRVLPQGSYPSGVDGVGQVDRQALEGRATPIPWAYGYAGYDGTWEKLHSTGNLAGGFVEPSSGLLGLSGGDALVTHFAFITWFPSPQVNVIAFAAWQQMQGSGERGNIQGLSVALPCGHWLAKLVFGRWETPHTTLPIFGQLSLTWVGRRSL